MKKLFEILPDKKSKFFSILTSSKKEIYADILLLLQKASMREIKIRKEDFVFTIENELGTKIIEADFSEDAIEFKEDEDEITSIKNNVYDNISLTSKINILIRKLEKCGWIEIDQEENTYKQIIVIPAYTIPVINFFAKLVTEQQKEYRSYVYSTYSSLKNTKENINYAWDALYMANRNTEDLKMLISILFSKIKEHYVKFEKNFNVNNLLKEHCIDYQKHVIDNGFQSLKTEDSVPRFKNQILKILYSWQNDETMLETLVEQGLLRNAFDSKERGYEKIQQMINFIIQSYEEFENNIEDMDKENNKYITATIGRINYLLTSDKSIRGKLSDVLTKCQNQEKYKLMQESLQLYKYQLLDKNSLYKEKQKKEKINGIPIIETQTDNLVKQQKLNSLIATINNQYTTQKIDSFINKLLNNKEVIDAKDIEINSPEDFLLLFLSVFRATDNSVLFKFNFDEKKQYLNKQGNIIPEFFIRRKQNGNV